MLGRFAKGFAVRPHAIRRDRHAGALLFPYGGHHWVYPCHAALLSLPGDCRLWCHPHTPTGGSTDRVFSWADMPTGAAVERQCQAKVVAVAMATSHAEYCLMLQAVDAASNAAQTHDLDKSESSVHGPAHDR